MIARRSALVFAANVMGALLGYVGLFALARLIPNSDELIGLVAFGLGFVGSFFVLTGLGVPTAHIKRISQGEPLERCVGTYAVLKILQVSLATGGTLLALYVWTEVMGRGFETPLHLRVIFAMLLYYVILSTSAIANTTFNARLETAKSQMSHFVGTAVRVVGMVIVAIAGLGALALAWAYIIGVIAMASIALFLFRHYPIARPRLDLIRSYLKFALPLSIPVALTGLSANIDKVVIQLFWSAAEVGYYFAAQRVVLLLTVITSAVSLLLFPSISRYHARNELDMLRTKANQAERYLSMILAPIAAFLLVYPEGVIHVLLSDTFLPAADVLRLFSVALYLSALIVPRRAILQGMDRPDLVGLASLAGALITLALYFILVPTSILGLPLASLGPVGAAGSVLIGYAVVLTLALLFSRRLVGDRLQKRIALHIGAAAAVGLLFLQLLAPALGLDWRWFHLLAFGGAFLGAYLVVLALVREFRKPDLLLFFDILDPRKMARYVRDELRNRDER